MSHLSIMIPSLPPSPPESPSRQFGSPDWFRPIGKGPILPGGKFGLNSPPLTPPLLSPISTISSDSSSSDDGDTEEPPIRSRLHFQTHRRASGPTYFTDASPAPSLPRRPSHPYRARFASMPVTGMITPMWNIGEEDSSDDEDGRSPRSEIDPFKMLLPFCKPSVKLPAYTLNEKDFVLAHVPTKRLAISAFKPRMPRIPRWQRPILMAVLCVMLFGSMCIVSWLQQSALHSQRASVVRQTVWLAKMAAEHDVQDSAKVDMEPGYKPANPSHHSLNFQDRVRSHPELASTAPTTMTKSEELAALMSFITGTTANSLPPINPGESIDPEILLPFDPYSTRAKEEMAELVSTQWDNFPIMVLGKLRDPGMRELRQVFKSYNIKPLPVFIDFDQRPDADTLEPTLARLIGTQDAPYVLLKGESVDPRVVSKLTKDEKVVETLAKIGASVAKKLKKNKHQKEEERQEMDRVLGPAPISDE
ncbi:hypothetical protein DB88DRAFT_238145 [Papiliotrema laurentii]|uniref:Uncharacterized protein n=1 Tax=Papiliotrema laurentii TaxID=5418 RepID=A0AAD9FRP9_PAPLA|nr:hypothetical protein DB88DRAFT_238145 [Papiliotrema laurentii]